MVLACLALAACAAPPAKPVDTAPAKPSLQDYLQQAAKAKTDGSRDKARDAYRTAAKMYPTQKEPWDRLSEDYLDAGDYGQAILAAQEALNRDGSDSLATGVIAVSGLRVSSAALQSLRAQSPIVDNPRFEAQNMVRTLKEVLAEPAAAPAPMPSATPPRPKKRVAAVAAPPKPADAGNPFDKLK